MYISKTAPYEIDLMKQILIKAFVPKTMNITSMFSFKLQSDVKYGWMAAKALQSQNGSSNADTKDLVRFYTSLFLSIMTDKGKSC